MREWLLKPAAHPDLPRLLGAWRLWFLGILLGGLLGWAFYQVFPPPFRVQATVVVDHNLEQVMPEGTDRDLFYYLTRESLKLEEVAWSDATLAQVAAAVPGVNVADLRRGGLQLAHPQDGAWRFIAEHRDRQMAAALAAAWAQAFVEQARAGVSVAARIEALQRAPDGGGDSAALAAELEALEAQSLGISPALQISLSQAADLPPGRASGAGTYALAGAILLLLAAVLAVLVFDRGHDSQTAA